MRTITVKQIFLFLILIGFTQILTAQKAPIKYGKIDIEDLKMTRYEPDTSAVAVVLCDYGVFDPDLFEFSRICRIKILKKDGVDQANIYIRSGANLYVKGKTYNLVDGKIEITKMKSESIFDERVESYKVATRFSLPNVKEGSIIEFTYFFPGLPYSWYFQREIPVMWSELRMPQSRYVTYQKNFFGFEPLSVNDGHRWVAKDMPAFRKEPFMNSVENYLTKFEIDIRDVSFPGYYDKFTTSWEEVSEDLLEHDNFGLKYKGNLFLNEEVAKINSMNLSNYEKAKYAYELIKKKLSWNDFRSIYAYYSLKHVYTKKKSGGCAEINLTLVSLLNKLGFEATPVVLSTRENGMLSPIFPSINKLDYIIVQVEIDDKTYLLDATDKKVPFGMLPKRCVNGSGRLVNEEKTDFIDLSSKLISKETIYSDLTVSSYGELKGSVRRSYLDYAAYDFRKKMEEYTSEEEYVQKLESQHAGMSINDYEFENIDSIYKPIVSKVSVNYRNDANIISDEIYINPAFIERFNDNPFKIDERNYPVDFIHPIEKRYILSLDIPEGYKVTKLPQTEQFELPNRKASFSCIANQTANKVQYSYVFKINEPIIISSEYKILRKFYELIIAKHSELVILKKEEI